MRGYLIERKKTKATRWIRYFITRISSIKITSRPTKLCVCTLLIRVTVIKVILKKPLLLPRRFFTKSAAGASVISQATLHNVRSVQHTPFQSLGSDKLKAFLFKWCASDKSHPFWLFFNHLIVLHTRRVYFTCKYFAISIHNSLTDSLNLITMQKYLFWQTTVTPSIEVCRREWWWRTWPGVESDKTFKLITLGSAVPTIVPTGVILVDCIKMFLTICYALQVFRIYHVTHTLTSHPHCSRLNGELSTYHNYMVKRLVDGNTYQVRYTKKHQKYAK